MKLLKVSIPNFRNLKNVELTFEPSLKPSVFPIGSNDGKKTLFLELIFTLLLNNQTTLFRGIDKDFYIATIKFTNGDVVDYHFKDHQVVASKDISLKCYLFLPLSISYFSPLINVPFETKNGETRNYYELIRNKKGNDLPTTINYQEQKIKALQEFFKKKKINNAIILMDGIENNLHPDWQYNIVNELASWGDNQYLLATHSFYLCEALTPGHVKIIT